MLALACSVVYAGCAVSTRILKDTPTPVILFYHTVGGFTATLIFLLVEMWITGNPLRLLGYDKSTWLKGILAAWFDVGALVFITIAYQKDSSGFVALFGYMNIVYAYICDQLLFHE